MRIYFYYILSLILLIACADKSHYNTFQNNAPLNKDTTLKHTEMESQKSLPQTEAEWKKVLTEQEYYVLRQKGTERPFTGEYTDKTDEGIYVCKGCGTALFKSETKFDSHCGWPSFYAGIDKSKITETKDYSHGMIRIEVTCTNCGGHLGHVFDDGPEDKTGLRYCINSVSLGFIPKEKYDSLNQSK